MGSRKNIKKEVSIGDIRWLTGTGGKYAKPAFALVVNVFNHGHQNYVNYIVGGSLEEGYFEFPSDAIHRGFSTKRFCNPSKIFTMAESQMGEFEFLFTAQMDLVRQIKDEAARRISGCGSEEYWSSDAASAKNAIYQMALENSALRMQNEAYLKMIEVFGSCVNGCANSSNASAEIKGPSFGLAWNQRIGESEEKSEEKKGVTNESEKKSDCAGEKENKKVKKRVRDFSKEERAKYVKDIVSKNKSKYLNRQSYIRIKMEKAGMSLDTLAEKCGVSKSCVGKWYAGWHSANWDVLERVLPGIKEESKKYEEFMNQNKM